MDMSATCSFENCMNNISIQTYDDLLLEEKRLRYQLKIQQEEIRVKVEHVKERLQPATRLLSALGKFTHPNKGSLLNTGVNLALDLLLKRSVFKKAGWLTSIAAGFLVRNVAKGVVNGKANGLFNKALRFFKK